MKTFVIGSLNTDFVISSPAFPRAGQTLSGSGFMINAGGKGANQAMATAKLGGEISMCGVIGGDPYGAREKESLREAGADVSHVRVAKDKMTGAAVITVSGGDNTIIIDSGANGLLSKEDVDSFLAEAKKEDILLCQLENPIDIVGYALKKGSEIGMTVVLNPAPASDKIMPYLKYVGIITPNETELEFFGGRDKLLGEGIPYVVTTLGEHGYEIASKDGAKVYPCIKVKPVDSTAAGDTFCGGMCAMLSKGKSLEESCAFASKAASISVTRHGAGMSIPTAAEVEDWK